MTSTVARQSGSAPRQSGSAPRTRHAATPRRQPNRADASATRRTLVALLASALAALPLKSLISDYVWLIDIWLTMVIVVGPAALLRRRRAPGALDIWPGVVLAVPWLTARFVPQHALAGFIPTGGTGHDLALLMDDLHTTTRDEVAPVHSTVAIKLVLCALLGLLAALIDLIAVVGRRGALAGVPLLVVFTVSGAVPREPVSWLWFVFAAVAFLLLLSLNNDDELSRWGRRIGRSGGHRPPLTVPISAQRIGVVAVVIAILVPLLVPDQSRNLITDAFHNSGGSGSGSGSGSGAAISPFANLKGQLDRDEPVNVLSVTVHSASADRPPFYLRSTVLDKLTEKGWRLSDHGDTLDPSGTFQTDPPTVADDGVAYDATVTPFGDGGNPPVFAVPTQLSGLDGGTKWSPQDQLLVGSELRAGASYRERFVELAPSAGELRGATGDIPADMSRWLDTSVVPREVDTQVARLTRGKTTPYDRARAITDFFADPSNNFQYSLKTKVGDSRSDLVNFLQTRIGYCQQYAAATAAMFRVADIPSRVVLGYMHSVANPQGKFTINSFDAHAWVEAYFKGVGWVPFDTTPIAGLTGGSKLDRSYAPHDYGSQGNDSVIKSRSNDASTSAPAPSTSTSSSATAAPTVSAPADRTPLWIALALVAVLAVLLTPGGARVLRRRRRLAAARDGDPDPLWAELSDTAIDLGYVWSPSRSPRQVAAWLHRDAQDSATALDALALAVEQQRYGPGVGGSDEHGGQADAGRLRRELVSVIASLRAGRSGTVRVRARLWPVSLLRRVAPALARMSQGGRRRR